MIISLGYIAKRSFFDIKLLPGLNHFVYYIAVPALLYNAAARIDIASLLNLAAIGAFTLTALITSLVAVTGSAMIFSVRGAERLVMRGLNASFSNYAYMGIPLSLGLLGEQAYAPTIAIVLLGNLLLIGGSQITLESIAQHKLNLKAAIDIIKRSILSNPIFLATLAGLFASATQTVPPEAVQTVLNMLAPAAIPVALFCLGASLQFSKTNIGYGELMWMIIVKLIIHPTITLLGFKLIGIEDAIWLLTAVLLSSLPTGALAHVVAMKFQVFEKETSQTLVFSTVFSLFTVSAWANLLL